MTTLLAPAPEQRTDVPGQAVPVPAPDVAPATRRPPTARRLALTGRLTKDDTGWLEPQLAELVTSGAATVEVDLSAVEALDGAVARLLLRTSWRLGDPARTLLLVHPQRQVHRVLRFYGAGGLVVR
jgi:ABC-type transporter Mla MlaB component